MPSRFSTDYRNLRPYVLEDVRSIVSAASVSTGGGSAAALTAHRLNDTTYHIGQLDPSQATWALTVSAADLRYVTSARQIIAGDGLTGGGTLAGDVTLNVGAGAGITVAADTVALTTPGTLTVSSTNSATGSHTHAVTASADVGTSPAAALLKSTSGGGLTLGSMTTNQAASLATFASGFAGSGWRADYGVTTASRATVETDDLTVRGRMRVYELLIQQIRATNGSVFVSSASKVVAVTTSTNPLWTVNGSQLTFNGSNANLSTTLYTISTAAAGDASKELYHGFLSGDVIRAQQVRWNGSAFGSVMQSNLEVTAVANLYTYQAALVSGDAAAVGYDYVRLGSSSDASRRGTVYITSDDSAAPFIDIVDGVQYHSDWNSAGVARVRLGKLSGISDAAFGGTLAGYGLYANNVYLKGSIVVTGGSLGGLAATDVNSNTTTIDGGKITANSVTASQIAANTITAAKIAAGTITATEIASGTITGDRLSLTSYLAINSSTFGAAGVQLQYNGGSPRAYIGNGSTRYLQYDSSGLTIAGTITATSGGVTGDFFVGGSYGGTLKIGANQNIWLNDSGMRLVMPDTTGVTIPTETSAIRWFGNLSGSFDNTKNYTAVVSYRHTSLNYIDNIWDCYVGSTDYSTYTARSMIQAGRWDGATYSSALLTVERSPSAKLMRFSGDYAAFTSAIRLQELSATPPTPDTSAAVSAYMKADKIVFHYYDGTTHKYRYMDLASTNATWTYTTTAP